MSSWVISSNPTTYDAKRSLAENGEVDWVTNNHFEVGDTVYIYEVIPPRGRGRIVYQTNVTKTDLSLADKLDDSKFWPQQTYPKNLKEQTRFSRLKLVGECDSNELSLEALKEHNFAAPQGKGHLLNKKPGLLNYIQKHFSY